MKLVVVLESRFLATSDGKAWTKTGFGYRFWQRYLTVFDEVRVVARVKYIERLDGDHECVTGRNVSVWPVPHYIGPYEYLRVHNAVRRSLTQSIDTGDAILFRVPSNLSRGLAAEFARRRRPYGLEVVGDPYEVFAPGAFNHPLRPVFRILATRQLKQICMHAAAVSYVTRSALQQRYPHEPHVFSTHYSSVELQPEAYVNKPTQSEAHTVQPRLIFVGSLAQMYKGLDVLIRALHHLKQRGLATQLSVIGDGKYRRQMQLLARELSLESAIEFYGELPSGAAVRAELDKASLFVLPSKTEGLPRVIIEAMARSLPCIGSKVGGVPELLEEDDMVPPGDEEALATKIEDVLKDSVRMTRMSQRNLEFSRQFHSEILQAQREEFYRALRLRTEKWLATS